MNARIKRLLLGTCFVLVIFAVYELLGAVIASQNTGLLEVRTSDSGAQISVSQAGHNAEIVGVGKAKVRLSPGSYDLYAKNSSDKAQTIVKIAKKGRVEIKLVLSSKGSLPSVDDISFINTDYLLDYGVSAPQLEKAKEDFFLFSKSSRVVTVNRSSIYTDPHDRNSESTTEGINFKVSVDATVYTAKLQYSGLSNDARLFLYKSADNSLVFDSAVAATNSAD